MTPSYVFPRMTDRRTKRVLPRESRRPNGDPGIFSLPSCFTLPHTIVPGRNHARGPLSFYLSRQRPEATAQCLTRTSRRTRCRPFISNRPEGWFPVTVAAGHALTPRLERSQNTREGTGAFFYDSNGHSFLKENAQCMSVSYAGNRSAVSPGCAKSRAASGY